MKRFPFHPFCIGLFSIFSVYASNRNEAFAVELIAPVLIVMGLTAALLGVATLLMRNVHRAAILVAAIVFCIMTYGYWVDTLLNLHLDPIHRVAGRRVILVLQALSLTLVGYGVLRRAKSPGSWTASLNWFACILLACPLLIAASQRAAGALSPARGAGPAAEKTAPIAALDPAADRPDIYLIILDGHGRGDILRDQYHYDDSPFLQHLRDKGFYVADQSTSNYMWTMLSISSVLNMRYMDDLTGDYSQKWRQITAMLRNNMLTAELKSIGYRTVAYESMESWLSFDNADTYYPISRRLGITPLQQVILDTSALSQFGGESIKSRFLLDQFHLKREMFLYKMARVPRIAALPGPKFVFLHIYEPHTPFVFAADGSDPMNRGYGSLLDGISDDVTPQQYHDWYREQAIYADNQVAQLIDKIIARSRKPPVIVLMGDHGPRSGMRADPAATDLHECLSNLTAVYFPGKHDKGLYPQITPVNLFRVVLNDYFNAGLPLLADKSFYSFPDAYNWTDVTAVVKPPVTDPAAAMSSR